MKTHRLILLATLCLASCDTPEGQRLTANALKNADAALLGGISTGTWSGAVAGLTAQEIANIRARQKTAAKNPAASVIP